MENIGWASLEVVPSLKGFEGKVTSQTAPAFAHAGSSGGLKFGDSAGKSMSKSFLAHAKVAALGAGAVLGGVAAIGIKFGKDSLQGYEDHLRVVGITKSTIKATGQAANVTAKQVGHLSDTLEKKTGVDGDLIQSGANMLLTFKNVRNEAGKGNKIFDQSLSVLNDMSTAMGTDAKSGAIQLGKALNDPVAGISALSRVGVTFDASQKKQIANFVKQGEVAKAQKIILGELTSEFGGAAKAQETMGDRVTVAYHKLQDEVGKALLPEVRKFERFLSQDGIPAAEHYFHVFEKQGIPAIKGLLDSARPLAESILPAAKTGFKDVAGFLKTAAPYAKDIVDAFNALPASAQKAVVLGAGAGILAKKTGALSLGKAALSSGGAAGLSSQIKGTPVDPVWVRVVNGGLPGEPTGVPTGGKPGALGEIASHAKDISKVPVGISLAVGSQIVKGVFKAADVISRAKTAPNPFDPNALSHSQIGGAQGLTTTDGKKIQINFDRLSHSLDVQGQNSKYANRLLAKLSSGKFLSDGAGPFGRNDVGDADAAARDLRKAIDSASEGLGTYAKRRKELGQIILGPLGVGADHKLAQGFKDLPARVQTVIQTPGLISTRADVQAFARDLHLTPKQVRTIYRLEGLQKARADFDAFQAHMGRHQSFTQNIELAGPGSPSLDGVRRH